MTAPAVYPTPWTAGYETMKAATFYAGVIHRMRNEVRRESRRCPHNHKRPDLATACALRMLAEETRPLEVGDRVVYQPSYAALTESGVVTELVNDRMVRVRYDGDQTAKATYLTDLRRFR